MVQRRCHTRRMSIRMDTHRHPTGNGASWSRLGRSWHSPFGCFGPIGQRASQTLDENEDLLHFGPDVVHVRPEREIRARRLLVVQHDVGGRPRGTAARDIETGGEPPVDGALALETDLGWAEELDLRKARDEGARRLAPDAT